MEKCIGILILDLNLESTSQFVVLSKYNCPLLMDNESAILNIEFYLSHNIFSYITISHVFSHNIFHVIKVSNICYGKLISYID